MKVHGRERCGVTLDVDGTLDIDSVALTFNQVHLSTPRGTEVDFSGKLGMGDFASDPSVPLGIKLNGAFAPKDMSDMFPAFMPYFAAIPEQKTYCSLSTLRVRPDTSPLMRPS